MHKDNTHDSLLDLCSTGHVFLCRLTTCTASFSVRNQDFVIRVSNFKCSRIGKEKLLETTHWMVNKRDSSGQELDSSFTQKKS